MSTTVSTAVAALDDRYPPAWAEDWDRVGLVVGDPAAAVTRVLCVVDCVPETVAEAVSAGVDLIVAHHPLLMRGVSSVATTSYKGRIVRDLIKNDVALFTAHTNADVASPGVSDALAARLGLVDLRPLVPSAPGSSAGGGSEAGGLGARLLDGGPSGAGRGIGRIGRLPVPRPLSALTAQAAAVLPRTAWGVRAAGDPDRVIETVAVCGGAGDSFLAAAAAAGVDAYLTADLRHHPVSEAVAGGGPALLDAAHWATERPWLDDLAAYLRATLEVDVLVSDLDTDPWTLHATSALFTPPKEPLP